MTEINLSEALQKAMREAPPVQDVQNAVKQAYQGDYPYGNCPICQGAGWFVYTVAIDDPLFGKPQKCTNPGCDKANRLAEQRLVNYDLPASYRRLSFDTWKAIPQTYRSGKTAAYLAAVEFVNHPQHYVNMRETCQGKVRDWEKLPEQYKNSLVLYGPMGTGKTGLVACIMTALSRTGYTGILYRRTSDLFIDLQSAYNDRDKADDVREKTYDQRLAQYQKATILILDEWGINNMSDFKKQAMEDIIRYRHGHELPTLITTNMSREESYKRWSEQTADVLAEMAHWILLEGAKLRNVA